MYLSFNRERQLHKLDKLAKFISIWWLESVSTIINFDVTLDQTKSYTNIPARFEVCSYDMLTDFQQTLIP